MLQEQQQNMADGKEVLEDAKGLQPSEAMKIEEHDKLSQQETKEESENEANNKTPEKSSETSNDSTEPRSENSTEEGRQLDVVRASKLILRPSQLNAGNNSAQVACSRPVLMPARFQNPFKKLEALEKEEKKVDEEATSKSSSPDECAEKTEGPAPSEKTKPKFLPLVNDSQEPENSTSVNSVSASTSAPSFVFGQNLKERVTGAREEPKEKSDKSEESNENGSSELLFSNAAAICRTTSRPAGLTLSQAAQEMEEANRANKRKYSQVNLITGEEGETNVLQIDCKLFAFDKATSGWQERGRGTLRLNDMEEESRLVGRTAGTQKVVLNTKVWYGMTVEKASSKSLRLTAQDVNGEVRIFVVQASPKEVDQLYSLLQQRLKRAQERYPKKQTMTEDH